jgi:uncharacterized membrane protein
MTTDRHRTLVGFEVGDMLVSGCAILSTAIFTGAAIYVSLVEHPARSEVTTECAIAQWRPSYRRAAMMQAALAIVATVLAIASWISGAGSSWLLAAVLIASVVPFTLVVMWPINKQLENSARETSSEQVRVLLNQWGRLHAVRSALSLAALLLMIFVAE